MQIPEYDKHTMFPTDTSVSPKLKQMITHWEDLQARLEVLARSEHLAFEVGNDRLCNNIAIEDALAVKQESVLEEIVAFPCESIGDVLAKLTLWKQCKAPGNANIEDFSLSDRVALSAAALMER